MSGLMVSAEFCWKHAMHCAAAALILCRETVGGGAFSGQARTLAGGPAAPLATPPEAQGASQQPIVHTITFYNEGVFTVNDGGFAACCHSLFCHACFQHGWR